MLLINKYSLRRKNKLITFAIYNMDRIAKKTHTHSERIVLKGGKKDLILMDPNSIILFFEFIEAQMDPINQV